VDQLGRLVGQVDQLGRLVGQVDQLGRLVGQVDHAGATCMGKPLSQIESKGATKGRAVMNERHLFDEAWKKCAAQGQCDAIGGAEYRRVYYEWLARGKPLNLAVFIRDAANRPAPAPTPEEKHEGKKPSIAPTVRKEEKRGN
jgi:hypothetical protein